VTDITSIRWQQNAFEYAVIGNASFEELSAFVKGLAGADITVPEVSMPGSKPQVEVATDLERERNDQKSADAGSSPWKLDPAYVAQVFISLKLSPEGIKGEYPVRYEDIKVVRNDCKEAVLEVNSNKTGIRTVYLKKLIRQDSTGIWTVTGYDGK
jgi:hypothetical protein